MQREAGRLACAYEEKREQRSKQITEMIFAVETHNAEKQLECFRSIEALEAELLEIRKEFLAVRGRLDVCAQARALVRTLRCPSVSASVLAAEPSEDAASSLLSSMTIDSVLQRRSTPFRRRRRRQETEKARRAGVQSSAWRGDRAAAQSETDEEEESPAETEEEAEDSEEEGQEEEGEETGEVESLEETRLLSEEAEEAHRLVRYSSSSSLSSAADSVVEEGIVKDALEERREFRVSEDAREHREQAQRDAATTTWRGTLMEGALLGHRFEQLQKRKLINSAKVLQH
nr:TPA: hypothetical protein BN1205_012890 [Toxoplasma gondii VEG]